MWEESLIFMLIYFGIFFILPDKIRKNKLFGMTALGGLVIGLYSIYAVKLKRGKEAEAFGIGDGCGATNVSCQTQDSTKPFCLINEKDLPTSDVDQTVVFNVYGQYVRIYASQNKGDGNFSLSQVVVNNATGTNIALNKTASSTSMYSGTSLASIAVDGNLTPRLWPTITHNNNIGRTTDYWQVDLGSLQMITTVRVISRADCCESVNIAKDSSSNPDRVTGLRIVVLQNTTDTFDPLGVCVATPTPIYPVGTTDDEKVVIGTIILSGQNGQIALNVYRALKAGIPSSLTQYGLTDSQSAEAFLKIRVSNIAAQRKAGTIDDTSYYSQTNDLKGITTMSAIPFNTSSELNTYMIANTKVKINPVKDSFGNAQFNPDGSIKTTTVSDGGAVITTGTILNVLMPKRVDNSAGYSGATVPDPNTGINGAPNSDLVAKTLLAQMPQQKNPIVIPTPTKGVIITPDMTPAQKAAAIANATNFVSFSGQTFDKSDSDSAAASTLNAIGYSAPNSSVTTTGQAQWYMITTNTSSLNASNACKNNGGKMATLDQIKDAQTNGASWGAWAWYADTFDTLAYPKTDKTYVSANSSPGGSIGVNCYGPKPARGTPGISPWTDTAKTANSSTYIANDWSKRVSKTPLKTAEVFAVGGSSPLTLDNAKWICNNLGGDLATLAQLNLAQANGAQWCSSGFLKDSATGYYPMQEIKPGCGNIGINSYTANTATCYGIKPSMDGTTNTAAVPLQPTDTSIALPITVKSLTVAPFSSKTNAVSWSQTSLLDAGECVFGTTATICSGKALCVQNGKTCAQATCNSGTNNNGNCDSTASSSYSPPTCPSLTTAIICSGKIMCTPVGGNCSGATVPGSSPIITTPSDISKIRFIDLCEKNMKAVNYFAKNMQTPLTLNRASWPIQPVTVFTTPAVYYLPDSFLKAAQDTYDATSNSYKTCLDDPNVETNKGQFPSKYQYCNFIIQAYSSWNLSFMTLDQKIAYPFGPRPPSDPGICKNNTNCKLACCSGVTPVWSNVYLTGLKGVYPDNKGWWGLSGNGQWWNIFYDNYNTLINGGYNLIGVDQQFDTLYTCPSLPGANCLSDDQCAKCDNTTGVCSAGTCYKKPVVNTSDEYTPYTTDNSNPSSVNIPKILGQYVCIKPSLSMGDGFLNISQIVVTDYWSGANLSKGKNVKSTATYAAGSFSVGGLAASSVVDGTENIRAWPSIWHSDNPPNRETDGIEVDLGNSYYIGRVIVFGRSDACCINRTYSLRVGVNENSIFNPGETPFNKCI